MARGARGVTCVKCGCLNFSSEHEVCDKCCPKPLEFRPTARHASISRQREDTMDSNSKKRRYEETNTTSNKGREQAKPPAPTKKQPDVIDLVSDDDEDVVEAQKVVGESLRSIDSKKRQADGQEDADGSCFQSRMFADVTFRQSDFPSMEEGVMIRKGSIAPSQSEAGKTPVQSVQTVIPSTQKSSLQQPQKAKEKPVDPKPMEPRPPPKKEIPVEKKVVTSTPMLVSSKAAKTPTDVLVVEKKEEKCLVHAKETKSSDEDPFYQSRAFDAVEFQASDFVTVFDGLAVARRSQPPSTTSSVSSKVTASTSVGPAVATVSANPIVTIPGIILVPLGARPATASHEVSRPAKTVTVPKANAAFPDITKKLIPEGKAVATATTIPVKTSKVTSKKPVVAAATPIAAKSKAQLPSPKPQTASKPTLAPTKAAVLQPATLKPKPVQVAAAVFKPSPQVSSTSAVYVPPVAVAKVPAIARTGMPPVVATMTPIPSTFPRTKQVPATKSSVPRAMPKPTANGSDAVNHAASKTSSVLNTDFNRTKATGSANVLLPKKKHPEAALRTDHTKKRAKLMPDVTDSSDADAVLFVKVNAAPLEIAPVEPPILGYCSPEFLAFMRECGDEDADEDDDPEEVSRSQLKLLDVVDLTNLSDSEDSDTESPSPTPRASGTSASTTQQRGTPAQVQMKSVVTSTESVPGSQTWCVPTLDSQRTRTRPEKVICELCEETGLPSRLVLCLTCTKYYHRKCARENGDENVCWNCDLGSMIDDSKLDEEHDSEYLAYLRAIKRSGSPGSVEEEEEEEEEDENPDESDEVTAGNGDVEMTNPAEGGENSNSLTDDKSAGKRWKEFIGDATADLDESYHEVTKRIAEELRDKEKKQLYSRGFVSREEFETQMAEVEEYYISEEARLQQLEREKALEGRKAAEARRAQAAAEEAALASASNSEQPAGSGANENQPPAVDDRAGASTASSGAVTTPNAAQSSTVPSTVAAASTAPSATPFGTTPRPPFSAVSEPAASAASAFRTALGNPTLATVPPPAAQH